MVLAVNKNTGMEKVIPEHQAINMIKNEVKKPFDRILITELKMGYSVELNKCYLEV
jgi:hypothetical protein